eukprot:jgi/Hompol1/1611/HPOL_001669-RA
MTPQLLGSSAARNTQFGAGGLPVAIDPKVLSGLSRIYVGSVQYDMTEEHMRLAFVQFGAIKSVSMTLDPTTGRHKGFCFIEFEAPEATLLAIDYMNGFDMGGRPLRVGRPSNFANYDMSTLPQPNPARLYVSNISDFVNEEDIRALFETFGTIQACVLVTSVRLISAPTRIYPAVWRFTPPRRARESFVQFADPQHAVIARTAMSGFEIGGRNLHVQPTVVGLELPLGMSSLASGPMQHMAPLPHAVLSVASNLNTAISPSGMVSEAMLANLKAVAARSAGSTQPHAQPAASHQAASSNGAAVATDENASLEEPMSITASQRYSIMQKLLRTSKDSTSAVSIWLIAFNLPVSNRSLHPLLSCKSDSMVLKQIASFLAGDTLDDLMLV